MVSDVLRWELIVEFTERRPSTTDAVMALFTEVTGFRFESPRATANGLYFMMYSRVSICGIVSYLMERSLIV